jgi:hypothetical protein
MSERLSKTLPILVTVAWGLAGAAGALPAMFAVMLFDAPGSESRVATITLAAALMAFPLVCLVSVWEVWNSFRMGNARRLKLWACAPLLILAIGAAAAAWVEFVQGGQLNG